VTKRIGIPPFCRQPRSVDAAWPVLAPAGTGTCHDGRASAIILIAPAHDNAIKKRGIAAAFVI
jgi:hypothetical protein